MQYIKNNVGPFLGGILLIAMVVMGVMVFSMRKTVNEHQVALQQIVTFLQQATTPK